MTKLSRSPLESMPVKTDAAPPPMAPRPFTLLESTTLFLSAVEAVEAAREHQMLPHSPTERDMEATRLRELTERLKNGVWLACNWATVVYQGVKYRMNGQHSSQAMLDAADFLPARVAIHLDHYEATTALGMGALFRQFDARFSGRSKADVAGAFQGLVPELQGVNRRKAKLGIDGIAWYLRSPLEGIPVPSGDELYQTMLTAAYHPFLRWLDKILSIKTPELEKAPIVGAMYASFLKSESGAQEFWSHVAKSDLVDDSDPRLVLSQELLKLKEDRDYREKNGKPGVLYAVCAKAWQAFRTGEKVRSLKVNISKGLPPMVD